MTLLVTSLSRSLRRSALAIMLALPLAAVVLPCAAAERSLQEVVAKVEHDTNGKVLSVQTLHRNGHTIYRLKVLTRDGRMQVVQVKADE